MRIIKKQHYKFFAFITLLIFSLCAMGVAMYVTIASYTDDKDIPDWSIPLITFIIGLWSKTPDISSSSKRTVIDGDDEEEEEVKCAFFRRWCDKKRDGEEV